MRTRRKWIGAVSGFALMLFACAEPPRGDLEGTVPPALPPCAEGRSRTADGRCDLTTPGHCPAGTAGFVGSLDCAPIGASCTGFSPHPSGWGCELSRRGTDCPDAMRPRADGTCVPVGDCGAPFPPTEATLFVDDSYAPSQLDGTHFASIGAAVQAASAGAVIAVEAGTYAEPIIAPWVPLTLVGRCAEQVKVVGTGGNQAALYAYRVQGIVARGLTLSGHIGGVFADAGGSVLLEDAVVSGNQAVGVFAKNKSAITLRRSRVSGTRYPGGGEIGAGIVVNSGSSLVLEDTAVVDNDVRGIAAGFAGTTVKGSGCFVAGNGRGAVPGEPEAGVFVSDGAAVELEGCALDENDGAGLYVQNAQGVLIGSFVARSRGTLAGSSGVGVFAATGATVLLEDSTVAENPVLNLYASGSGSFLAVRRTTVRGPFSTAGVEVGRGAHATLGGHMELSGSAFVGLSSAGIAFDGANGTLDRVLVRDVREIAWPNPTLLYGGFGVLVESGSAVSATQLTVEQATLTGLGTNRDATLSADAVLVRDTRLSTAAQTGCGIQVAVSGSAELTRAVFERNLSSSVLVTSGGSVVVQDAIVADTLPNSGREFGYGFAIFNEGRAQMREVDVRRNAIGLVAANTQVLVAGGSFEENGVALHAQDGSFIREADGEGALVTGEVRVATTTAFEDNGTRVGSGTVPLPAEAF